MRSQWTDWCACPGIPKATFALWSFFVSLSCSYPVLTHMGYAAYCLVEQLFPALDESGNALAAAGHY
ncbi:hypothetical protein FA95DRAFT_1557500 [Auriscalpium vulgare]|uniref:Uncharacterized protein n=1 Tax=Auriscalpium vulgare TaxID=40419 RepID=A0ACB8RXC8_9AGAM|nr:hypothetical protein FA95DRAFT_1557500 [Auriscalpium vulgare]